MLDRPIVSKGLSTNSQETSAFAVLLLAFVGDLLLGCKFRRVFVESF
jgi:hypothetical protein